MNVHPAPRSRCRWPIFLPRGGRPRSISGR
jgi:hypothetical protein